MIFQNVQIFRKVLYISDSVDSGGLYLPVLTNFTSRGTVS